MTASGAARENGSVRRRRLESARRIAWLVAGILALLIALVGVVVPLLPTVPFVIVAAACFTNGCQRCERWMIEHPLLGPPLRDWREHRAVPLRAKQFATLSMAGGCAFAAWFMQGVLAWLPVPICIALAAWLWSLPTRPAHRPPAAQPPPT